MAHVTIVSCFFHITGPDDTKGRDIYKGKTYGQHKPQKWGNIYRVDLQLKGTGYKSSKLHLTGI